MKCLCTEYQWHGAGKVVNSVSRLQSRLRQETVATYYELVYELISILILVIETDWKTKSIVVRSTIVFD